MATLSFRYTRYSKYKECILVSKRTWIIFAAICAVVLGGLVYLSGKDKIDVSDVNTNSIISASEKSGNIADHVFGKKDSKVILVEYGDYQCPGCGSLYPRLKTLSEKYEGQIAFVFRNFPLTTIHPNARAAAAVAESAGLMGKYWEMHNLLYENQDKWKDLTSTERTDVFVGYAKQLGLNETTFKDNLSKAEINQKISFDQALGKKLNITGTPSIYLDGTEVKQDTWASDDSFDKAIQAELKKNDIELPKTDS